MTLRPPFTPITTELYRQMPEGPPYYQLIEGNLIMSPSPNFFHQQVVGRLYRSIGNFLDDHSLGELAIAPSDVFLDEINVFQPDIYYVTRERLDVIVEGGVEGAPDLVIEVLSPSTSDHDKNEKKSVYARAGVKEMWIIDAQKHQIEIYSFAEGNESLARVIRKAASLKSDFFPGLEIDTVRLFKPMR